MPIHWNDSEVKDRLLAAIIASFPGTINCKEVARIFGGDATYSAIENFLRVPKRKAVELKAKAAGIELEAKAKAAGIEVPASPARTRSPRKPKADGVKAARVTKKTKKASPFATSPVKQELHFDDDENINVRSFNRMSAAEEDMEINMDDDDSDEII